MKNLKKALCLLLAAVMLLSLAACGGKAEEKAEAAAPAPGAEAAAPVDPFAPYEETVTLTSFFEIAAPIMSTFDEAQLDEYKVLQDIKAATNVEVDYLWYAADTEEDAETKKNTAIATGDIPDFMIVSSAQLALLAKSDLINKDLMPLYETYASDTLKAWTTAEGNAALDAASKGGKLIAIPLVDSSIDGAPFLWVRNDWLKALNLEQPTTVEELYDVMKAFKEQDPDGNGKDDTVGMALHKNFLSMATGDAVGLFNGFKAYPAQWIQDGNGGLMYGSAAPEIKDALSFLAKCYAEGLIEQDFSVKDDSGTAELTAAGTAGVQYGAMWNAMWPLSMTNANNPNADWVCLPVAGNPQINLRIVGYVVINSECEHPEAVIKLLNAWCDAFANSSTEVYNSYLVELDGTPQFPQHHVMLKTWNPTKNLDAYYAVKEAMETGDTSKMNAEELGYYNDVVAFEAGDPSKLGPYKTYAPEGSAFDAMDHYYTNELFHMNEFTGAQTDSMAKKMSIVEDKVYEYYTKVIMGVESIDTFDAFVAELNNLGLADITAEVNEWYAAKQ